MILAHTAQGLANIKTVHGPGIFEQSEQERDYGNIEKVGPLGMSLPRNDERIRTEAGDLILYQGNALVIYYDTNSWSFTRLGKIDNETQSQLKTALGRGYIIVTLMLVPD